MKRILLPALLLATAGAQAQPARISVAQAFGADGDRPMIGVSTSTTGRRDTLGLYISSVTANGPAEKAGLEEGNRIASINGVSLRLSRDDAGDQDMGSIAQNRLIRELRKVKAGDEVSLEIYGGGRTRTVKVKTVAAEDLNGYRTLLSNRTRENERAAIGVFLSTTGSKRDTAGVFVSMVVEGGPAEKAGLVEGDRIASINGVDVRVSREDAGDASVASSRISRLEREITKLKPGETADLNVVSGGRARNVKVTTIKESDLPAHGYSFRYNGPGDFQVFGRPGVVVRPGVRPMPIQISPKVRIFDRFDEFDKFNEFDKFDKFDLKIDPKIDFRFDNKFYRYDERDFFDRDAMDKLRTELQKIGPEVRRQLDNEMPRAMEDLKRKLDDLRIEIPKVVKDTRRIVIL